MKKAKDVIRVDHLFVERDNDIIVRDANFVINSGDYVGIVGPNGGGKTTLIHAILGILPKKKGIIHLFGEEISSFSRWEQIAYVSQNAINFDIQFPLTVRELVTIGRTGKGRLGRRITKEDKKAVDEMLKFMGIEELSEKRIGNLSDGQKQRAFVSKALVKNPSILVLDEPIAGIDAETQEKFYKKLADLNMNRGTTILIVSHDLAAVFCRMSKVICVNRDVHTAPITPDIEPNEILKKAYGEHFHFVFHRHQCNGVFDHE